MNIFTEAYEKRLSENEKQKVIWENYLQNLKDLDFSIFVNKMKVPSLIPIGSRIMFRGELIHTNEVTVALGANYFVKCSVKQADVIKQHRIRVAGEKLQALQRERDYLENHLAFTQNNIFEELGKEIVEPFDEKEENEWRKMHRQSVRKYIQENKCSRTLEKSDNLLWERLEELELREELENELNEETHASPLYKTEFKQINSHSMSGNTIEKPIINSIECDLSSNRSINNLKERLLEVQCATRICSTEADIFTRLEQLEEQERLEEELDRLERDDSSNNESDNEDTKFNTTKKSISFASDFEGDCMEIVFKHSKFTPDLKEYNTTDGIEKPSDIYLAFPENFEKEIIVPILKTSNQLEHVRETTTYKKDIPKVDSSVRKSVNVIREVVEKTDEQNVTTYTDRPPSKFKLMRMKKDCN